MRRESFIGLSPRLSDGHLREGRDGDRKNTLGVFLKKTPFDNPGQSVAANAFASSCVFAVTE
jgi:hypothetical protein